METKYKFNIIKHYNTLDEAIENLKLLKDKFKDIPEEDIMATVVSVETTDPDYPYGMQLNIWSHEYKDTFRTNIFLIENGMLLDVFGSAGELEFDPLKNIDDCIEACCDELEAYLDMWYEQEKYEESLKKEGAINVS